MKTHFYSTVALVDGNHFTGVNSDGLAVETDSRPAGEKHAGPNPLELFLLSIGGCAGMETLAILKKRKIPPQELIVNVEGIKREAFPRICTQINLQVRGKGNGITVFELNKAVKLILDNYCSVTNMLDKSVSLNWKCEVID